MAAHEENFGNTTATVPDPQGEDRSALDASTHLDQLGDVRLGESNPSATLTGEE